MDLSWLAKWKSAHVVTYSFSFPFPPLDLLVAFPLCFIALFVQEVFVAMEKRFFWYLFLNDAFYTGQTFRISHVRVSLLWKRTSKLFDLKLNSGYGLTVNIGSNEERSSQVGGQTALPEVHLYKLVQGDAAVPVPVVLLDGALDPLHVCGHNIRFGLSPRSMDVIF